MPYPPIPRALCLIITIIHESLLEIPTKTALQLSRVILPSLQRLPSRRIHIHTHHDLPFLIEYTDIIPLVIITAASASPCRWEEYTHYRIGCAIPERQCMC